MLSLYRRHLTKGFGRDASEPCPHRADRYSRKCHCPIWVTGTDPRGTPHRHTLNTDSWATAEESRRKIDAGLEDAPRVEITVALDAWLDALRAAKRKERTVSQVHGAMTRSLSEFCDSNGHVHLDKLTLPVLDRFVATWKYASTTHRSRIDLMRSFFKFCVSRKGIRENPAAGLIKPKEDLEPTLPSSAEEEGRIFSAAEHFAERRNFGGLWAANPETARALLLVMRWTGLRASGSIVFEPRAIESMTLDDRAVSVYRTHQTKTGEYVMCPMPADVAKAIRSAPRLSEKRAFIPPPDGRWKTDSRSVANGFYTNYLCPISVLSGVPEVRAHRFRDTFAVRLLESGKP